ncbi:MAG: biopolymer transporter ExbD [Prevotella sp.]|nr:biopolymer transporter ExbD [Prevotella sp.]
MRFRRRHKDFPELNTTSTADISFMLLVFFLVTSSMDSDKGLGRKLAPIDEQQQEQVDVNRSDVLQIRLDERDSLFCDDQPVTLTQLQQQVESFVASRQTDRYIIAVQTARTTTYDAYFEMQNAVVAAYRELREKMAQQKYGRPFSQCTEAERDIIRQRYPQRISEGMGSEE